MTKVKVDSGICGFSALIMAEKDKDNNKKIYIFIDTECEMVKKMLEDISTLDARAAFTGHLNNQVYRSAAKHIKHVACPVPAGILKAIEVESGVCLPKNVSIVFIKE